LKLADFTETWVLPIQHWSASSLNMLSVCPRQWQARYIWGRKEAPGAALILGTANHSAMGFNLLDKITTGEDKTEAEVVEYFNDKAWPDAINERGGAGEVKWDDGPEEQRALGAKMVSAYHLNVAPRVEPTSVEAKIEVFVPQVPVPVIGYVDVVQAGNRPIIDLKTSAKKRSDIKPDWRLQGRIYQLAFARPVDWHVVTKAKVPTTLTGLDAPGLMQDLEVVMQTQEMVRQLSTLANHYMTIYGADQDWPQLGVSHDWRCNWCAYRSDCPAWRTY
jgi:hypothetical protein